MTIYLLHPSLEISLFKVTNDFLAMLKRFFWLISLSFSEVLDIVSNCLLETILYLGFYFPQKESISLLSTLWFLPKIEIWFFHSSALNPFKKIRQAARELAPTSESLPVTQWAQATWPPNSAFSALDAEPSVPHSPHQPTSGRVSSSDVPWQPSHHSEAPWSLILSCITAPYSVPWF